MALKKGDFVTLDFTGSITETQDVFDTTIQSVAQKHGIQTQRMTYEPITICIGEGHVLPGLDKGIEGQDEEAEFSVDLKPEDAFGKKQADRIKLMPKKVFDKQEIRIAPGLQVNIDNMPGTIKSISGNRVVVDFNHRLAGKGLTYIIKTQGKVTDDSKQVQAIVDMALHAPSTVTVDDKKAVVEFPMELPKELQEQVTEKILANTSITSVEYKKPAGKQNA
jgi:FKBP-type peptidyl-prolyl cis-trans isomerase SlyD